MTRGVKRWRRILKTTKSGQEDFCWDGGFYNGLNIPYGRENLGYLQQLPPFGGVKWSGVFFIDRGIGKG
jgi:hypothetical protein